MVQRNSSGSHAGARHIDVPALGRKFWTITSCTWPWRAWAAAMATSASSRSRRVSPMPTRIPVVNGTRARPAASRVARRRAGVLSGAPACGPPGSARRAASVSIIIPCDGDTARRRRSSSSVERAGVGVGEQPGLGEHRGGGGDEVVDRRGVAARRQPGGGVGVARLGRLAQGEQRLVTAERGAPARDGERPRRARGRATPGARAAWRTCSSRTCRGTAS